MLLLHFYDIWGTIDYGPETPDYINCGMQNQSEVFCKKFVLECKLQRVSSDCAIFANEKFLVMEFGKGKEWLTFVGGISYSYRKSAYARRNDPKST